MQENRTRQLGRGNPPDKNRKNTTQFTWRMKKKLVILFFCVLVCFAGLGFRLIMISRENGEEYKRQVLSQLEYDSVTIPARRGEIFDRNGTVLATSERVYNVILDTKILLQAEQKTEGTEDATVAALTRVFGLDASKIRGYIASNPTSQYYILAKKVVYDKVAAFEALTDPASENYDEKIKGVWFENEYVRKYPNHSLASDVIGFTSADGRGQYGLEEYYNTVLSGTAGREYGYLDDNANLERTTIAAQDGNSIVTTIDGNVQTIIEKYLLDFNEEYKNKARIGNGAQNVGCIIMEADTGNILGMASYPNFDLNDPRNKESLVGMARVDEKGKLLVNEYKRKTWEAITEETIPEIEEDNELLYQNYNALWKNFCITDTYEPGSVAKPFTVATALETGSITGNEVYNCKGMLEVGGHEIKCHNTFGDGSVSVTRGIVISCNVAMMYIGQATGSSLFAQFQKNFGFGLKTNIDLAGEARTVGLTYSADRMGSSELATNTFGQGFNVDMIEMISAFCSLVNGGNMYEPHVVSKIVNSSGATVQHVEPRLLRQTISQNTSDRIIEMCNLVVSDAEGTGRTARPAGYRIGGKTGTAETLPRRNGEYVVSFMGYAPADDPKIVIYCVVDRPNAGVMGQQADAKYATRIVRKILTEVLPYLNIQMTEELSEKEQAELQELRAASVTTQTGIVAGEEETAENAAEGEDAGGETTEVSPAEFAENAKPIWKTFDRDAEGYYINPNNGNRIDPVTGFEYGADALSEEMDSVAGVDENGNSMFEQLGENERYSP
ncbi:MAG: penicillin-binding protein 2 [Lachnospiraceae bacterium]|nr:penicillin-binding protein 2 [Lachnospiraceae bacterium]